MRRIEHAFAAIDRLAAEANSARAHLDKLDQAILAKALRGKLVPQDSNDEPRACCSIASAPSALTCLPSLLRKCDSPLQADAALRCKILEISLSWQCHVIMPRQHETDGKARSV